MKERKLKELFEDESIGKIVLPNFQRDFVWDVKQQRDLLATFLVELPISSILLLKGSCNDFNYRKLCYKHEINCAKEECFYLLDGQQRMSTLKAIFSDLHALDWEKNFDDLYYKIKNLWFLKIESNDSEDDDIFGYRSLNFEKENLRKYTPSEVVDFIEPKRLHKTKIDWFHPNYKFFNDLDKEKPLTGKSKLNKFAEKCSDEKLVPLWGLVDGDNLQEKVLSKIAHKKSEEIIAEIEDIEEAQKKLEKINYYFEDIKGEKLEMDEYLEEVPILRIHLAEKWKNQVLIFLQRLVDQNISLIEIEKNEISRGISIFETINKGGTPLDNFDLIVAKAAKNTALESLTQRIKKLIELEIILPQSFDNNEKWSGKNLDTISSSDEISKRMKNQYLNILSIFSHVGDNILNIKLEHVKREKIFEITSDQINNLTEKSISALLRAIAFFNIRLGIKSINEISFELMILPISFILSNDKNWENKEVLNKLEFWYWISIFTGRYRDKQNIRCVEDIKTIYKWVVLNDLEDDKVKDLLENRIEKVLDVEEYSDYNTLKNDSLTEPVIKKNLLAFILSRKPYDLKPGEEYSLNNSCSNLELEEHHLIPLGNDTKLGESSKKIRSNKNHILNSVLNKTLISKDANRAISNMTYNKYIKEVKEICRISHFIDKNIEREVNEQDEKYYERVIKSRYDKIRDTLLDHLYKLKGR